MRCGFITSTFFMACWMASIVSPFNKADCGSVLAEEDEEEDVEEEEVFAKPLAPPASLFALLLLLFEEAVLLDWMVQTMAFTVCRIMSMVAVSTTSTVSPVDITPELSRPGVSPGSCMATQAAAKVSHVNNRDKREKEEDCTVSTPSPFPA